MRTFIQLKDGIGWASVNTNEEIVGSIEVDFGAGDLYLKKKYTDGVWSDAEIIRYAEVGEDGSIIEIKRTYFPSDVSGPIMDSTVTPTHKWIDEAWVAPVVEE